MFQKEEHLVEQAKNFKSLNKKLIEYKNTFRENLQ